MTEPRNPYAAPQSRTVTAEAAPAIDSDAIVLLPEPVRRRAGEGSAWVGDGWRLFRRQPGLLVGLFLVYFVMYLIVAGVLGLIPVAGGIAGMAAGYVLLGGVMIGIDRLYRGETITLAVLFDGFRHEARDRMAMFGVITGLLSLAIGFVAALAADALPFWQSAMGLSGVKPEELVANGNFSVMSLTLYMLYALLLGLPLLMAIWFAGGLILYSGVQPLDAMRLSFKACLRNILSLTVYNIVLLLLALATVVTLFLGMLVWMPLLLTSWYVSYRRIFTQFPDEPLE